MGAELLSIFDEEGWEEGSEGAASSWKRTFRLLLVALLLFVFIVAWTINVLKRDGCARESADGRAESRRVKRGRSDRRSCHVRSGRRAEMMGVGDQEGNAPSTREERHIYRRGQCDD